MQINVTQNHIDSGTPNSCKYCPVALAIRELNPDAQVYVGEDEVTIREGGTIREYPLPNEAYTFIREYDCDHSVSPFSFELPIEVAI